MKPCGNPACRRWVKQGKIYCCLGCLTPGGTHTALCDGRAAERGERAP